jgi:hypothetical protein
MSSSCSTSSTDTESSCYEVTYDDHAISERFPSNTYPAYYKCSVPTKKPSPGYTYVARIKIRCIDIYDDEEITDELVNEMRKKYDVDNICFKINIRPIKTRFEILDM